MAAALTALSMLAASLQLASATRPGIVSVGNQLLKDVPSAADRQQLAALLADGGAVDRKVSDVNIQLYCGRVKVPLSIKFARSMQFGYRSKRVS